MTEFPASQLADWLDCIWLVPVGQRMSGKSALKVFLPGHGNIHSYFAGEARCVVMESMPYVIMLGIGKTPTLIQVFHLDHIIPGFSSLLCFHCLNAAFNIFLWSV